MRKRANDEEFDDCWTLVFNRVELLSVDRPLKIERKIT